MKAGIPATLALAVTLAAAHDQFPVPFDLVIRGGMVLDGTGAWARDRITRVAPKASGSSAP